MCCLAKASHNHMWVWNEQKQIKCQAEEQNVLSKSTSGRREWINSSTFSPSSISLNGPKPLPPPPSPQPFTETFTVLEYC